MLDTDQARLFAMRPLTNPDQRVTGLARLPQDTHRLVREVLLGPGNEGDARGTKLVEDAEVDVPEVEEQQSSCRTCS